MEAIAYVDEIELDSSAIELSGEQQKEWTFFASIPKAPRWESSVGLLSRGLKRGRGLGGRRDDAQGQVHETLKRRSLRSCPEKVDSFSGEFGLVAVGVR